MIEGMPQLELTHDKPTSSGTKFTGHKFKNMAEELATNNKLFA